MTTKEEILRELYNRACDLAKNYSDAEYDKLTTLWNEWNYNHPDDTILLQIHLNNEKKIDIIKIEDDIVEIVGK